MTDGLYHAHQRKLNEEDRKEESLLKMTLDRIVYPIALLVPLFSVDQALNIWATKNASGVSFLLWVVIFFSSIFWIFYGSVHKEKAIVFAHAVMVVVSLSIIFQIIIFS